MCVCVKYTQHTPRQSRVMAHSDYLTDGVRVKCVDFLRRNIIRFQQRQKEPCGTRSELRLWLRSHTVCRLAGTRQWLRVWLSYLGGVGLLHDHVGLTAVTDFSLLKDLLQLKSMNTLAPARCFNLTCVCDSSRTLHKHKHWILYRYILTRLYGGWFIFSTLMTKKISAEG